MNLTERLDELKGKAAQAAKDRDAEREEGRKRRAAHFIETKKLFDEVNEVFPGSVILYAEENGRRMKRTPKGYIDEAIDD